MCKGSANRTEERKERRKKKTWPDSVSSTTQREVWIRVGGSCERRAASDSDVLDVKPQRKKPTSKRRGTRAGAVVQRGH